ncbi:hypothetical protein DFP72DRAFT_1132964 [Ephemerocybe angulata]|uniref:Nephrocystin 3-like N-terminal domain-containing protein n=1 Tax=Ephemerocybe angulata TaxID=980116 RepID=A0A8H6HT08_9AGAR|nr:hypothetical protein DFP72DRAFT_1132964 [Tulosesus angulatus]
MHTSDDRCDAPKCHPETRVAVQADIMSWIAHGDVSDPSQSRKIMWVTGPAGTGKTAIAGSIAQGCQERGLLAGSFFFSSFSGDAKRRSKRYLVPTLAYQITRHACFKDVGESIALAIKHDPAIFDQQLKDQLEALILKPLRTVRRGSLLPATANPQFIRYPDKWRNIRKHEDEHLEILSALLQASNDPAFPFRILLFSRPEPSIRTFFSGIGKGISFEIFLDSKYSPDADIALFLKARFAELKRRYPRIPASWPPNDVLEVLVANASGQFIYAATVLRYIDGPLGKPQLLLDHVLESNQRSSGTPRGEDNPLKPLDMLYTSIIQRSPDHRLLATWIRVIIKFTGVEGSRSHDLDSAFVWRTLLSSSPEEADSLLENMQSLMSIPPSNDLIGKFSFYHKSFPDFMADPKHCMTMIFTLTRKPCEICAPAGLCRYLKDKRPSYELTPEETSQFFYWFIKCITDERQLQLAKCLEARASIAEADLLSCDVSWWMDQVCHHFPRSHRRSRLPALYIFKWFVGIHQSGSCNAALCHSACRYWRRSIISYAKERNRVAPGNRWLIREWFVLVGDYAKTEWDEHRFFIERYT